MNEVLVKSPFEVRFMKKKYRVLARQYRIYAQDLNFQGDKIESTLGSYNISISEITKTSQ